MDETTRSWSERERNTKTNNSETRIESQREKKRKNPEESACYFRVSQQTLDLIHCQSKLIRISRASAQGAEIHHIRVGEREIESVGGGFGERIRKLEVLLASKKESERASKEKGKWKTGRKQELEIHHGAQGTPVLKKGERQKKNYGERESEGNWNQNDRDTGRKKEEETESTMWHMLHT